MGAGESIDRLAESLGLVPGFRGTVTLTFNDGGVTWRVEPRPSVLSQLAGPVVGTRILVEKEA